MHWWDKLVVAFTGGVRIRTTKINGVIEARHLGRLSGLPPERLTSLVRELAPDGVGVVHLNRDGARWQISVKGKGFDDAFEQRLRNVLVNF